MNGLFLRNVGMSYLWPSYGVLLSCFSSWPLLPSSR